mmetsp:Transcript_26698/g.70093  ORF Transcript_26698/g.70093 Transcript_26698/m.70093 type:complete len:227 (-) Transcript_26698:135-815(-)
MLSVGPVLALGIFLSSRLLAASVGGKRAVRGWLREHCVEDAVDVLQLVRVEGLERKELQNSKKLGLEPRSGHVIILVVLRAFVLHEVIEASEDGGDEFRPLDGRMRAHLEYRKKEPADRCEKADVAVVKHGSELLLPDIRFQHVIVLAVETQQANACLPLDIGRELLRLRQKNLRNIRKEVVREFCTAYVRNRVECQRSHVVVARVHVRLDVVHHQTKDVGLVSQE